MNGSIPSDQKNGIESLRWGIKDFETHFIRRLGDLERKFMGRFQEPVSDLGKELTCSSASCQSIDNNRYFHLSLSTMADLPE
jgi:hypothetical protein